MREHLYQGKDTDSGKWVEGNLIHRTDYYGDPVDDYFIVEIGSFDYDDYFAYEVDPDTVSEFTGLRDKNKKRIFEGDIVKWVGNGKTFVDEVTFNNGQFKAGDFPLFMVTLCDIEIIGNKWDNPELLKGGAE